eukprot:2839433-Amphidinium_carterae.3
MTLVSEPSKPRKKLAALAAMPRPKSEPRPGSNLPRQQHLAVSRKVAFGFNIMMGGWQYEREQFDLPLFKVNRLVNNSHLMRGSLHDDISRSMTAIIQKT